ncbi:MAG: hypothetical protein ACYTE5_02615 [Planctomycetota bacterium]
MISELIKGKATICVVNYRTVEMLSSVMGKYVMHLAHATQVINTQEFPVRRKTARKCHRPIDKVMSSNTIQGILTDGSLD